MDGSAPDAPEVSADIDSPEKPESVSGAGGFETDRTRRRTPKESEDELTAPYKKAGYKTQYSTKLDEDGNIVEAKWGEKGSRRPDAYDVAGRHGVLRQEVRCARRYAGAWRDVRAAPRRGG